MEGRARVVLDTNVLVAAAYNAGSASRRIVEACLAGKLIAVLSPALRREYELILSRAVRRRSYLERLQRLLEQAEVVVPEETPRVVAEDADDDKLVAAALAVGAVVVSNDGHLLAIAGHKGLQVQRPADICDNLP
jgi:putative PIN family toxin of toxin-antitoxin system